MEARAAALEARAQFAVVVDLAVEDDHQLARCVHQRLIALGTQVDDRQSSRRESDTSIVADPDAARVGSARTHPLVDRFELLAADWRRVVAICEKCGDSAHTFTSALA